MAGRGGEGGNKKIGSTPSRAVERRRSHVMGMGMGMGVAMGVAMRGDIVPPNQ